MPFGEQYVEQHATNGFYSSPFRFNNSRERSTASAEGSARSAEYDEYTDQYYYGARSRRDFEHKPKRRSATLARPSPAFWRGYYNPTWSVWLGVDPLAHEYRSHSSYSFTANNPITLIDPDGRKIVWAQNPETAALEARVMALVQSNIYLRTYFNYIKNSNITINVDAGVTAQQKVRAQEKKSKDVKGAMEPNGSLLFDNYSDRTIFEEFFHAFQYCIISENLHQIVVKDGHTPSKLSHEAEVRLMLYEYNMILLKNEEIALFNNLNSNDNLDYQLGTFQKAFEPYFQIVYNGGNPSFNRDYSPAYSLKHLDGLIKQMRSSSFHKWINSDIIKLEELEKEINN